jgi:hypothetical protein
MEMKIKNNLQPQFRLDSVGFLLSCLRRGKKLDIQKLALLEMRRTVTVRILVDGGDQESQLVLINIISRNYMLI